MPRSAVPGVAEAAAIGIAHPKWDERPLLVCVAGPKAAMSVRTKSATISPTHVAKWWLPDAIEFVDELPHTATGKLSKMTCATSSAIIASPTPPRWWAATNLHVIARSEATRQSRLDCFAVLAMTG